MQNGEIVRHAGAPGCFELGEAGLVDTSACCGTCHSAEGYADGLVLGPCRATLPGGEEAFVCCSSKKRLLREGGPDRDPHETRR